MTMVSDVLQTLRAIRCVAEKRAFRPALALLLIFGIGITSAHATQTFGNTTPGTTVSSPLREHYKRGSQFTLTETGTVENLCAYIDGMGGGNVLQQLTLLLYSDAGGIPGTLVNGSYPLEIQSGMAPQWVCAGTWNRVPLQPGSYWIVLHTGYSNGLIRYYYDATQANWYGNADTYSDGPSREFGPGGSGNGSISAYATYSTLAEIGHAGRTTVGAAPSGPLRAHFKRGSSFEMKEHGNLRWLQVYIDTLAGAPEGTWQKLGYVLYRDSNGVPSEKLAEVLHWVESGYEPQWVTIGTDRIPLQPGRYWIMIHSGDTAGVARYYADGTGNWYGNADNYDDGASNPFGAGGTGDGTLSAFISYDVTPPPAP